ncbi:thiolase-like protein [Gorgonomyces haynaldii]|nr:thiolase-like protein [Gorgonomyces haynaldii]
MSRSVYVVGVGMSKFAKPGRRPEADYVDDVLQATCKALLDANLTYDDIQFASVGYCYGDSTCGQRALYQLGLTQIPIVNVNNNCSTGSTALYLARQAIQSGDHECVMAVGFEKMNPGSLSSNYQDRTNPMDKTIEIMSELRGLSDAPFAPQIFGNAAIEYCEQNKQDVNCLDLIAYKSHNHSTLNPYAQFQMPVSMEQVRKARTVFGPMTLLHCSPTSDGAGAVILCSEAFVLKHNLGAQAVELVGQVMATDSVKAFDPERKSKSCLEVAGADMTRRAMRDLVKRTGVTQDQVDVVELHDCFSGNELVTYDALGLCEEGKAVQFLESGAPFLPQFTDKNPKRRIVVNPSGGLISKGHPLGATGLAQCCELVWQLRGWTGKRQVPHPRYALQHNIGLGGAVVIGLYKKANLKSQGDIDSRKRFGYNPAVESRQVTKEQVQKVMSRKGGLIGMPSELTPDTIERLQAKL